MKIQIQKPSIPPRVQFLAKQLGLIEKPEFHVTVAGWGETIIDIDLQKATNSIRFLLDYRLAIKSYGVSEFLRVPHTRLSIIQIVESEYIQQMLTEQRMLHVTLFVGCGSEGVDNAEAKWMDGIGIFTPADDNLILEKLKV